MIDAAVTELVSEGPIPPGDERDDENDEQWESDPSE